MLESIKDGDLVITQNHIKENILKEISKEKKLINCKFMTIEEFKRNSLPYYDEQSLYFLMKKYNLKYSAAKEYLDNIFLDENHVKTYYEELKKENLIINNKYFKPKNIIIIGYDEVEPYLLKKINNIKVIKEKEQNYNHKVYEFETETDELVYVASKIIEDLKTIDIEKMRLVIPNDDYLLELDRIFKLFKIPIQINNNQSIYSTKTAHTFLKELKTTKNINDALQNTPQNDIYNQIIDILNKYSFIKEIDSTFTEILENEFKNKKIKTKKIEGGLKVIKPNEIYDKENHYYILGFNQNLIPKIYEESGIIPDNIKEKHGIFTTTQKNKNEKENIKKILTHFPNIYISYKLKDNFESYYPSALIEDLNLEVIKDKIKLNHSNDYNKLLLGSLLDDYINYNEEDENINKLYPNYQDLEYKTYNNSFKGLDKDKLKQYLKGEITLSYSSMNNFFLCPFKYYIENILKLKEREDTFPILIGNLFHHCLQNLYNKDFDLDTTFTKFLEDKELSAKEEFFVQKLKNILKKDIEVINMQDNLSQFKNKLTERKIVIEKNKNLKVKFVGIVDKISMLDNYIIITDYKTGNIETTLDNITDGLNMQLPTYIYLIKNGFEKDKKIVGFYLQKLLNNEKIDSTKDEYANNLKLNGYTINDENIIKLIDETYEDSKVIKGMKTTKTGFYAYTKLIKEEEIEKISNIVSDNIDKVIKAVENADFKINPKRLDNQLISCKYCPFKDLCFYKEEDITTLKQKPFKEIVGDENA